MLGVEAALSSLGLTKFAVGGKLRLAGGDGLVARKWILYLLSTVVVVLVSVILHALGVPAGYLTVTTPFLLAVVLIATVWGRGPATVAALASAILVNYLLIPPPYAFSAPASWEGFLFISLLAAALVLGTLKDRTLQIERKVRQLSASEELQKTLLGAISHDLKTPLTAILGGLNSLLTEGDRLEEGDRRELVAVAYDQAKRLDRLVTGVLEMTRIDVGAIRLRRDPGSVADLVQDALRLLGETLAERRCSVEIPPGLPLVSMDSVLLSHALANILENAAKFSPTNTSINVAARAAGGHIVISVADRGVGVPADELDRIFEKFFRGRHFNGLETAASGTGLGLAIAKGIVEAHGGRIWAEQRAGGGTVVSVNLPVTDS